MWIKADEQVHESSNSNYNYNNNNYNYNNDDNNTSNHHQVGKIAFLFMTRGLMPLEDIWREFFSFNADPSHYSIYIHPHSGWLTYNLFSYHQHHHHHHHHHLLYECIFHWLLWYKYQYSYYCKSQLFQHIILSRLFQSINQSIIQLGYIYPPSSLFYNLNVDDHVKHVDWGGMSQVRSIKHLGK